MAKDGHAQGHRHHYHRLILSVIKPRTCNEQRRLGTTVARGLGVPELEFDSIGLSDRFGATAVGRRAEAGDGKAPKSHPFDGRRCAVVERGGKRRDEVLLPTPVTVKEFVRRIAKEGSVIVPGCGEQVGGEGGETKGGAVG